MKSDREAIQEAIALLFSVLHYGVDPERGGGPIRQLVVEFLERETRPVRE